MIAGSFTWNGKSSDDFNMKMLDNPSFSSPEKDLNKNSVPGRNGSVLVSNQRMNDISVSFTYHALITDDFHHTIRRIKNWLLAPDGYQPIVFDWAPDLTYYMYFDGASLAFEKLSIKLVQVTVVGYLYPIAYYTDSLSEKQYTTGQTIQNNGLFTAKPKIRLVGTGNAQFSFGDSKLIVKNVSDQITVDSLSNTVYDANNAPAYSQIDTTDSTALPTLKQGSNMITLPDGWQAFITLRSGEFA